MALGSILDSSSSFSYVAASVWRSSDCLTVIAAASSYSRRFRYRPAVFETAAGRIRPSLTIEIGTDSRCRRVASSGDPVARRKPMVIEPDVRFFGFVRLARLTEERWLGR